MEPVGQAGIGALHQALEYPVRTAAFERRDQLATRRADLERRRVGGEGADREAVLDRVRAQHREGVPVTGLGDGRDLVLGQTPAGWGLWLQLFSTGTFQISSAYSRMARSDENQPTLAMLRIAERRQAV